MRAQTVITFLRCFIADYSPDQPRDENGRFASAGSGSKDKKKHKYEPHYKSSKAKRAKAKVKMSVDEHNIVSSAILTDHPNWQAGETRLYMHGNHCYTVIVNGKGNYSFVKRKRIK